MGIKYVAALGKIAKKIYQAQVKMMGKILGTKQEEIKLLPAEKSPNIFDERIKLENFNTADKLYKVPNIGEKVINKGVVTNIRDQSEVER